MKSLILVFVLAFGLGAHGQEREVVSCDEAGVGLNQLMVPVSQYSTTFYDQQVQAYTLDTIEPACCSSGVAIVLPDVNDPLGGATCFAVTNLTGVNAKNARTVEYNARQGLLIELDTKVYTGKRTKPAGKPLRLRINLANSTVKIEN